MGNANSNNFSGGYDNVSMGAQESNVFTSSQVNTPSTVAISVINVSEYAAEQDLLTLLRAWNLPQPLSVHFLKKNHKHLTRQVFLNYPLGTDGQFIAGKLNGIKFMGYDLKANVKGQYTAREGIQVSITGIPENANEEQLKQLLLSLRIAQLLAVELLPKRKGFIGRKALLYFRNRKEADIAVQKLDGFEILGIKLRARIETFKPKPKAVELDMILQIYPSSVLAFIQNVLLKQIPPEFKDFKFEFSQQNLSVKISGIKKAEAVKWLMIILQEYVEVTITTDEQKGKFIKNYNDKVLRDSYCEIIRTDNQFNIIFVLDKKEYEKLKTFISIQGIKNEKIEDIRIQIVRQGSDPIPSGEYSDTMSDISSQTGSSVEGQYRKKFTIHLPKEFDKIIKEELESLQRQFSRIKCSLKYKSGKNNREIHIVGSVESEVEEFYRNVQSIFPYTKIKMTAVQLRKLKSNKMFLQYTKDQNVHLVFTDSDISLIGVGVNSVQNVMKYIKEEQMDDKHFKFMDNIKIRTEYFEEYVFKKESLFEKLKITKDRDGIKIFGKHSFVKKAYKRIADLNQKLIVRNLEYTISSHPLVKFASLQIQQLLSNLPENFDSDIVGKLRTSDLKSSSPKVIVNIAGMNDDELNKLDEQISNLCSSLTSDFVYFKPNDLEKVNRLDVDAFRNEWDVELIKQQNRIILNGIRADVTSAKEALMAMFEHRAIRTPVSIPCRKLIHCLLMKKKKKELMQIAKENNAQFLGKQPTTKAISFKAFKDNVHNIVDSIEKLIFEAEKALEFKDMMFSYVEYCALKKLAFKVRQIKRKNIVSFMFPSDEQVSKARILTNNRAYYISLKCTDILSMKVDAIVNPANEQLNNSGGLAKIISDKAGAEFNKECQEIIEKHGMLKAGEAVTTNSGQLKCKKIINAVGPRWSGGSFGEAALLKQAVNRSLDEAEKQKLWSISIPAISSGIFNYPLNNCLKIITDAVFSYFQEKEPKYLRKCYIVTEKKETASVWRKVFKKIAVHYGCKEIIDLYQESRRTEDELSDEKEADSEDYYCWYYIDDDNQWKSYIPKYNKIISKAFNEHRNKPLKVTIENKEYIIDFTREVQKNVSTSYERKIQRTLPTRYKWTWFDGKGVEQNYSLENLNIIEEAYQQKKSSVQINLSRMNDDKKQNYDIIFDYQSGQHKQRNCQTQYIRKVRRTIEEFIPPVSELFTKTSSSVAETSSTHVKIVISGNARSIKAAENDIRSLLSSQMAERKLDMEVARTLVDIQQLIKDVPEVEAVERIKNDGSTSIVLRGLKEKIPAAENKILKSEGRRSTNYPDEWTPGQTTNCALYALDPNSDEFIKIVNRMKKTLPSCQVHRIERIQNKWLWKRYVDQRKIIELKNNGEANEKYLFHGTRNNPPENIYKDEVGFDMRYSAQGLWGRGCYFALNASYSGCGYEYTLNSGQKQIFFARVAVGDAVKLPSNSSLTMPTVKYSNNIALNIRYDTVNSQDGNIFIIYENSRAYPAYLITFN